MGVLSILILVTCNHLILTTAEHGTCVSGADIDEAEKVRDEDSIFERFERQCQPEPDVVRGELCNRACVRGESLVCLFKFQVEYYSVMGPACGNCPDNETACFDSQCVTADGYTRSVMTINRMIPGTPIQVCLGDTIVVEVENHMHGTGMTIHWHGIHQRGTQYMDGVSHLTQCPIVAENTFRYVFKPDVLGTYFYHAHDSFQKMDGLVGPLIVRSPYDPSDMYYDIELSEHIIVVQDWKERVFAAYMPGSSQIVRSAEFPDSLLINGRGSRIDPETNTIIKPMPPAEFIVSSGNRYRFRLINGGCLGCPLRFSVEGHKLHVIATDGYPIKPVRVDSIILMSGERYDFVLRASEPEKYYWINLAAVGPCEGMNIVQNAILRYEGAVPGDFASSADYPMVPFAPGKVMNVLNSDCDDSDFGVCIDQLVSSSTTPDIKEIMEETDVFHFNVSFAMHKLTFDNLFKSGKIYKYFVDGAALMGSHMNNTSFMMLPVPPLSQPCEARQFCETGTEMCCMNPEEDPTIENFRRCFGFIQIPYGKVVELLLFDGPGDIEASAESHPIHMHGHSFLVIDLGSAMERADGEHLLPTDSWQRPAFKDTIIVPSGGYAKVRFRADNPGYWLMHCHVLPHSETGMATVLRVGKRKNLPRIPNNFPTCGSFKPPVVVDGECMKISDDF